MEKLRPDDHFLILLEGDETPIQLGSLVVLDIPDALRVDAAQRLRRHLLDRLPATPLLRVLRHAPLSFDSDVWVCADHVDFDHHVVIHHSDSPLTDRDLAAFVERHVMIRLDLSRPPFVVHILDNVAGGRMAMYVNVHHCVTDGVGFQTLLGLLSDDLVDEGDPAVGLRCESQLPSRHDWLAASVRGFREERSLRSEVDARRVGAVTALRDPALQRPATPKLSLSGPTSANRAYTRITIPFGEMKLIARSFDATLNDLFLALVGGAARDYLIQTNDLPTIPLTTNSARSYRRPEHGPFGNRIVAIHPHLATHLVDPIERLRSIQDSMVLERRRTVHDEALLNQPETPFGPRIRRDRFAKHRRSGGTILPGNITVSNVPGPAHERSYAGLRQVSNHPTPLLGSGRPLNFTARRNADAFDIGLMADPEKIPDIERIATLFRQSFERYASLSPSRSQRS